MKITHYLYNSFLVESGDKKLAIDPGALFLYFFRLTTLIPKSQWPGITHVFVTHGDPDHYWHADRVAANARFICNATMARQVNGKTLLLGPRAKGVAFTTEFSDLHTISVNEKIELDGMSITGLKATHGDLTLKLGPFSKTFSPGPDERIGWGAIGFQIELDGRTLVNLGDTLLHEQEWAWIDKPDVLMIPIGGRITHNTMDEKQALQAVQAMRPKLVIPCHYNCPGLFSRRLNPADDAMFRREVETMGYDCAILHSHDSIELAEPAVHARADSLEAPGQAAQMR